MTIMIDNAAIATAAADDDDDGHDHVYKFYYYGSEYGVDDVRYTKVFYSSKSNKNKYPNVKHCLSFSARKTRFDSLLGCRHKHLHRGVLIKTQLLGRQRQCF